VRSILCAALAFALVSCSGGDASDSHVARELPDARLTTLAGIQGPTLSSCPTSKCLTVLVAPWCSVCHQAAPLIVSLRRLLDRRGVSSRVVVGASDDLVEIKSFAAQFGADALLDPGGVLSSRGVPLFLVTDDRGHILRVINGFPSTAQSSEDLARILELI
jgi:hypothetical protein